MHLALARWPVDAHETSHACVTVSLGHEEAHVPSTLVINPKRVLVRF